jgi:adenine-specific DNA glycosylase
MSPLSERLVAWQRSQGRHALPWSGSRDPYRVWLSEVMLQQTQVATVRAYYRRFLERFADVQQLAQAPLDEVLALWAGLGYYSRARNLHACAQAVAERGGWPRSSAELERLPGIGRSTARAIAAFCWTSASPSSTAMCAACWRAGWPSTRTCRAPRPSAGCGLRPTLCCRNAPSTCRPTRKV